MSKISFFVGGEQAIFLPKTSSRPIIDLRGTDFLFFINEYPREARKHKILEAVDTVTSTCDRERSCIINVHGHNYYYYCYYYYDLFIYF